MVSEAVWATAEVRGHQTALLAGLRVAVVPDCESAGVVGAEMWCRILDEIADEIRVVT